MTSSFPSSSYSSGDEHQRIAEAGMILRTLVGSTVHGLQNAGTDDRDELGVCMEPPETVIGLQQFEHWVHRTQPMGAPSGPGDLDLTIYSLRKFCRLALRGNPTVLLVLFARGDDVVTCTPLGQQLRDLAPAFVSRDAATAYLGYSRQQRGKLLADGGRTGARARERIGAGGYDTKYAMHMLRIAVQGRELLEMGTITLPVPEPDRSFLRSVRRGEVLLEDVVREAELHEVELQRLATESPLGAEPDHAAVDEFLISAHQAFWAGAR